MLRQLGTVTARIPVSLVAGNLREELPRRSWQAIARYTRAAPPTDVPPGRMVELPGRGRTWVMDVAGPSPQAPVLILLHALGTTAALSWYPSIGPLTERYRVIAFDQRWHGRGIHSERFRLEDCADDVAAVADALGVSRFIVVGYSMGGVIAQLVWRRHRSRVAGLVLAATARNYRGKVTERLWWTLTGALMARYSARAQAGAARMLARLPHHSPPLRAGDPAVSPWALAEFRSTSAWAMFAALHEIGRFDSSAWIRRVDVPTSVIVTTRDWLIPTRRQRYLAASIPGAVTFDLDGNHAALVLGAEDFVPVLLAACESVARRGSDHGIDRPGSRRRG